VDRVFGTQCICDKSPSNGQAMHFKIRVQIDDGEYKSMHYDPQTKHVNVLLKEFKQQK